MSTDTPPDATTLGAATLTARDYLPGTVRHIVLFRFAEGTSIRQIDEVDRRFRALASGLRHDGLPYIVGIESGAQISLEGAGAGFDRAYIVTFSSIGDRNYYVGTPAVTDAGFIDAAHASFKDFVGPLLATNGVVVFDFVVGN